MNRQRVVKGWAWAIQDANGVWCLCYWFRTSRKELISEGKPSPEARLVRVEMRKSRPRSKHEH